MLDLIVGKGLYVLIKPNVRNAGGLENDFKKWDRSVCYWSDCLI